MNDAIILNEYGQVSCPALRLAETADVEEPGSIRRCNEDVYVEWVASVPLVDEEGYGPEYAVTRAWRLVCVDGHVLGTSDGQDENPDPPKLAQLDPLLTAWSGTSDGSERG